jgi:hypothetical protein
VPLGLSLRSKYRDSQRAKARVWLTQNTCFMPPMIFKSKSKF